VSLAAGIITGLLHVCILLVTLVLGRLLRALLQPDLRDYTDGFGPFRSWWR
jgi:hypothetical protein